MRTWEMGTEQMPSPLWHVEGVLRNHVFEMVDRSHIPTGAFWRPAVGSSPSLLVVGQGAALRHMLQAHLQRQYQVAEAVGGGEAAQHLAHCPPQGLIVGRITTDGKEALAAALHQEEAPPVLKLWSATSPPRWADGALRHPFRRADLLRAVARLVHEKTWEGGRHVPDSDGLRLGTSGRT